MIAISFVLGVILGATFGFIACGIMSANDMNDEE